MQEKVIKKNISDQIVDIIREKIIKHEYAVGEKLPSENELAEMFGVSRMTARTVFQKLSSIGFVDIRNGDGTYAKQFDLNDYVTQALDYMNEKNTTEDINEFRFYFEPMAVDLASKKRSEKDIEKLRSILEEMESACTDGDVIRYNEADYRFHRTICKMTNNTVIIMLYELFVSLIVRDYDVQLRHLAEANNIEYHEDNYHDILLVSMRGHRLILEGIINGNCEPFFEEWRRNFPKQ